MRHPIYLANYLRSSLKSILFTVACTCALFTPLYVAAELVPIPGTRVMLEAPENFSLSRQFAGLQHNHDKVAIVATEAPDSYLEFSKRYSDESLRKNEMQLIDRQRLDKDGLSGQLLVVRQNQNKQLFERWIFITGDTKESVMVVGYFPEKQAGKFRAQIKHTLSTVFWDSARVLDHFEGLGFRVDDVPSLRIAARTGNTLVFTQNGRLPDQYYTKALLIISFQPLDQKLNIDESFARAQFKNISLLLNHQIDQVQPQRIRGTEAISIEGSGRHRHLGYNVAAIQTVASTRRGIMIAQGFTKFENRDDDFGLFRTTVGSFRIDD